MAGCTRRRGNKWVIIVDLPRGEGEPRRQKWFSGYDTKREAKRDLARIQAEIYSGMFVEVTNMNVAEYLRHWLIAYASVNVSAKTLEGYTQLVEQRIIPELGNVPLSRLTPVAIQTFYSKQLTSGGRKSRPLSARTVLHTHRVFREALRHAVKWEMLSRNPADSVEPPRPRATVVAPLDEEACHRLTQAVCGTEYEMPVLLALRTGMRRGEIFALRWADVDLTRCVAQVTRSLQQTKSGLSFKEPKSAKGRRQLALSPETVTALKAHKARQAAQRLLLGGGYAEGDLVCARFDGTPVRPNTFSGAFKSYVARRGFTTMRFHDLRHTHASLLLKGNIHPKVVSERLGHATIGITLDTYSHLLPGMQEVAALSIDAALASAGR